MVPGACKIPSLKVSGLHRLTLLIARVEIGYGLAVCVTNVRDNALFSGFCVNCAFNIRCFGFRHLILLLKILLLALRSFSPDHPFMSASSSEPEHYIYNSEIVKDCIEDSTDAHQYWDQVVPIFLARQSMVLFP